MTEYRQKPQRGPEGCFDEKYKHPILPDFFLTLSFKITYLFIVYGGPSHRRIFGPLTIRAGLRGQSLARGVPVEVTTDQHPGGRHESAGFQFTDARATVREPSCLNAEFSGRIKP